MKTLFALVMSLLTTMSFAADNMKAFPPADEGMVRYVINLPAQADETGWRVELLVGQTVQLDAANRYFFAGTLETETIEGWGFDRHILRQLGPMAGTLMAVNPDAPKVERFITLGGEPRLLRYNSRLPLVVYVPRASRYATGSGVPTLRSRAPSAARTPTPVGPGTRSPRGRDPAECFVAVRVAPEAIDDRLVPVLELEVLLHARRREEPQRLLVQQCGFAVHPGQVEEHALRHGQLEIAAARNGFLRERQRKRVVREGCGRVPVDVARELVEHQHFGQAAAGGFPPLNSSQRAAAASVDPNRSAMRRSSDGSLRNQSSGFSSWNQNSRTVSAAAGRAELI